MLPFKRGAFHLAAQVGFPIIPVIICGTKNLFQKKPFRINSGNVVVEFGKPIVAENIKNKKDELELMGKVRDIISDKYKELSSGGNT